MHNSCCTPHFFKTIHSHFALVFLVWLEFGSDRYAAAAVPINVSDEVQYHTNGVITDHTRTRILEPESTSMISTEPRLSIAAARPAQCSANPTCTLLPARIPARARTQASDGTHRIEVVAEDGAIVSYTSFGATASSAAAAASAAAADSSGGLASLRGGSSSGGANKKKSNLVASMQVCESRRFLIFVPCRVTRQTTPKFCS